MWLPAWILKSPKGSQDKDEESKYDDFSLHLPLHPYVEYEWVDSCYQTTILFMPTLSIVITANANVPT